MESPGKTPVLLNSLQRLKASALKEDTGNWIRYLRQSEERAVCEPSRRLTRIHFREYDGIRVNVGPSGQLVFGEKGTHRLAIALILGIRVVPAQIGCVYRGALSELPRLRASPSSSDLVPSG